MIIGKKSIAVFLVLVLIALGLDLAVRFLIDFGPVKARISRELAVRLQAEVAIDRMGLEVLPHPQLAMYNVRLVFADGTVLSSPLVSLTPSLRGLLAGRSEIVSMHCEQPDARIALRQQKPEADNRSAEARQKDLALRIESALNAIPRIGVTVHDGTVHIAAPDGSVLVLENIAAEAYATPQGVRISADCTSALWKMLAIELTYHDPGAAVELDVRDIDTVKSGAMLKAFVGEALPFADIVSRLSGVVSSVALKIRFPRVSDPLSNAAISGSGRFEDMRLSLPDLGLDVRELGGGFELDNSTIAATGISARIGDSRIQNAAIRLDRTRGFKPSLLSADFNLDLSEVPGLLHVIPDPDVRGEIALIKDPQGTASGTFTLGAETDGYRTEIAVQELLLQSSYRTFPPTLELSRGTCTYRDGLLSFDGFSGTLGSSVLPDFSLSFKLQDGPDDFTVAAQGATIDLVDLRMVLSSFDSSRKLIETITGAGGRIQVQNLSLRGPLTAPQRWTVGLQATLADVSVTAVGLDGPLAVRSGKLKADRKACTLSQADIRYLDAILAGSLRLDGYFEGIRTASADVRGSLGENALERVSELSSLPAALALRAPVKIGKSRFVWNRGGVITLAGDFVLGGNTTAGLNLRVDNNAIAIQELRIRDAASQCRLGIKIEADIFSINYAGMLKKDTLERVLLKNPFLQGWIQGDFSAVFNQKQPRSSSATGTLTVEKAAYPNFDRPFVTISSAEVTADDSQLVFKLTGLLAGQDSADMQGRIGFTDDGFDLDVALDVDSIDIDAITERLSGDNATEVSSAQGFWGIPLRGTLRLTVRELKKNPVMFAPFNALFAFGDRAVTMTTEDTLLCGIDFNVEVGINPDGITLEAQPRAMQNSMQEVFQCLTGEKSIITGTVDVEGSVRSQGKPAVLLDGLGGDFSITARDGRIYKSGLLLKILSFLSIRGLFSGDITHMAKRGYPYQSLHITAAVTGQTVKVQRALLISSSLTLVSKGTINFESRQVNLNVLATPFQFYNQLLSMIPLAGKFLSKPLIGVPLKITGTFDDPKISIRTSSVVTKGLMDITTSIIKLPIRIIDPDFLKKPAEQP